jgi:hypothetical protein
MSRAPVARAAQKRSNRSKIGPMRSGIVGAVLTVTVAMGCGTTPASELAKTPGLEEKTGLKTCPIKQSAKKPLIVEWPSADRGELENALERGVVVVRYTGCEIELLTRCTAPGNYTYDAFTPKKNVQRFQDADELWL